MISRKNIVILLSVLFVIICCIFTISYFNSTFVAVIKYEHITEATIQEIIGHENGSFTKKLEKSGEEVRLDRSKEYIVKFKAEDGYQDGSYTIDNTSKETVISPDFSKQKKQSIIDGALPGITSAIREKYPTVDTLFTIQPKLVEEKGIWCIVKLVHKKTDLYDNNSDDLRIIVKNENSKWVLVTKPSIVLSKNRYLDIPDKILIYANRV